MAKVGSVMVPDWSLSVVGDKISGLPDNHHVKRHLSSKPDDAFIPVYRQVLYDFVGWLATHLNQISHILVKPMVNSGMRPLAKARFKGIMRCGLSPYGFYHSG